MKEYTSEQLFKLAEYIKGSPGSEKWLRENNCIELAEFWDAVNGHEKSFQWLKKNGYIYLAAAVDVLAEKESAKVWLVRYGYTTLSAFCDAALGNLSAVEILNANGDHDWVKVAHTIFSQDKKQEKRTFGGLFNFGNPFK